MESTKINGASKYAINQKGIVSNIETGKSLLATGGKVRLFNDKGQRVTLSVSELVKGHFGESAEKKSAPVKKEKQPKIVKDPKVEKKKEDYPEKVQQVLKETCTKSDKIRKLDGMNLTRSEIAFLLGIRYQHVRNVLTYEPKKA